MVINDYLPEHMPPQRVIGSIGSWLIIIDITGDIFCLNSDTEARVPLPQLSEFPDVEQPFNFSENHYMVHQFGYRQKLSPRQMRDWYVEKIVLSSSPEDKADYIAFAIIKTGAQLAYCRKGDTRWRFVPLSFVPGAQRSTKDAVYYNGVFVALSYNGAHNNKEYTICDLSVPNDPIVIHHPPMPSLL